MVCCRGEAGCPGGTTADQAERNRREASDIEVHLFNIAGVQYEQGTIPLWFEPPAANLAVGHAHDDELKRLVLMLPPTDQDGDAGYSWPGCDISKWIRSGG